ncbi:protein RER1 isoform X2 [Odocoileus virginianus]|uniref:Protein RER1 n=2 Tax=Cervidae TaxID=9850 RepID=A0A6J0VVT4_ODOVR
MCPQDFAASGAPWDWWEECEQVTGAEMKVHRCCFACHVASWLSTRACRWLFSLSWMTRGKDTGRKPRMSEGDSVGDSVHGKPSVVYRFFTRLGQIYQSWLDKSTPHTAVRWVVTLGLSFIYMIRVYLLQGWYIVTYALGIYHLNLFIAFLSPKVDPSLMEDSDDGPSLPTKQNEEFRPFIRRLPEFKFWHAATKGILVAMVCTFFEAFNVPVFWPILVMYFIMLFCITMKRQIKHMIKYRYIPFTHGKRTYKGKEDAGKTFAS